MKDFFISYNKADRKWAEWIAWLLEEKDYSVVIQAWDFRPGQNFVLEMQNAIINTKKMIMVLSQDYLDALFTQQELAAKIVRDPTGKKRDLLPIRVGECSPQGLLEPLIYVDLIGLDEREAKTTILQALADRAKPSRSPIFPFLKTKIIRNTDRMTSQPVPYPKRLVPQLFFKRSEQVTSLRWLAEKLMEHGRLRETDTRAQWDRVATYFDEIAATLESMVEKFNMYDIPRVEGHKLHALLDNFDRVVFSVYSRDDDMDLEQTDEMLRELFRTAERATNTDIQISMTKHLGDGSQHGTLEDNIAEIERVAGRYRGLAIALRAAKT